MLADVCEKRVFRTEGRGLGEAIEQEVAPLVFSFPQITPLGEGDGAVIRRLHFHGIPMDKVLRKDMDGSAIQIVLRLEIQVSSEDFQ